MSLPQDYTLSEFDVIDSTNEQAKRLIISKEFVGNFVVTANEQTAGRGRNGRQWVSHPGNLYFSIIKQFSNDIQNLFQVSFVSALAMGDTLKEFIPDEDIKYKWPNDVLVDGKKISGILLELISSRLIIGVGVNLASAPDVENPATSVVQILGNEVDKMEFLEKFVHHFEKSLFLWQNKGFQYIREHWLGKAYKYGEEICIKPGDKVIRGIFREIDEIGNINVETADGNLHTISAGDMFF